MDLRPGGTYLYGMKAPDGTAMWGRMVYREIVPPERLVFINSFSDESGGLTRHPMAPTWPMEMLSVFTFEEQPGGKTKFTVRWSPHNATEEEQQDLRCRPRQHDQGWSGTMEQLEAYLAKAREPQRAAEISHELRRWICPAGAEEKSRRLSQHGEALRRRSGSITARWRFMKASPTTFRTASAPRSRAA